MLSSCFRLHSDVKTSSTLYLDLLATQILPFHLADSLICRFHVLEKHVAKACLDMAASKLAGGEHDGCTDEVSVDVQTENRT
jgi:hypothetical protein